MRAGHSPPGGGGIPSRACPNPGVPGKTLPWPSPRIQLDDIAAARARRARDPPPHRPGAGGDAVPGRCPVLDHGFVRVVDYMGDDAAIVQAARVSYGRGTRAANEDAG